MAINPIHFAVMVEHKEQPVLLQERLSQDTVASMHGIKNMLQFSSITYDNQHKLQKLL